MRRMPWRWVPILVLGTSLSWTAAVGQTLPGQSPPCGKIKPGDELQDVTELNAVGAPELSTTFTVQTKPLCVPTTKNSDNSFNTKEMPLRTYVYTDPKTGQVRWGFPGPTLRLRKANEDGKGGQRLKILLVNELQPEADNNACNNPCPASQPCDCSPAAVAALIKKCTAVRPPQECCCVAKCTQTSPNCLHGSNTTNLHFHGSHASPQPPQDYVLLDLKPKGSPPGSHGSHGVHGEVEEGQYQYNVDPFGWKQPEGTHWYHPHKHGSVGGQIANGMAGTIIIDGPFDDWLKQFYAKEKLIVIQQINIRDNFYAGPQGAAPQILVSGQLQPTITGKPGEVQRWRFVNATMSSGALINLTLPAGLEFRQIAMDGVRFSPVNYGCQPLINFNVNNPNFPCNPNPTGNPSLRFAPGNRADFLVRFPQTETPKGKGLRVERQIIPISGDEGGRSGGGRKLLMQREEQIAPGSAEPALFTVVVDDGIPGNERRRRRGVAAAAPPWRPTQAEWPPMPAYLQNITDQEVTDPATGQKREVKMTFQQFIQGMEPPQPWPYNQSPLSKFTIDGRQFCPTCANVTTQMGTAAEWTVSNDTVIPHPFHIHTNPFQLFSIKGKSIGENGAEPVWMDTLSMPNATADPKSPPADPTTPIKITRTNFVIRQRYEDFTGEYVLHCHFLGHEDRGMMFSVQTVCQDNPAKYGVPSISKPECKGVYGDDALKACTSNTCP
ncbi:MAG TPA: multicopper oxidase domain-containing protein [Thermoanaerobaculia bacterium]|nr:multicopper oxidase domain-containing protein [Thermoanaerobaculia bacterium]